VSDEGAYTVSIRNDSGGATSDRAVLKIVY
jgi:hypothetical protein